MEEDERVRGRDSEEESTTTCQGMFSELRLLQSCWLELVMYSSMRWPPMAVSMIPMGKSTPPSDSASAVYQHVAPTCSHSRPRM